MEKLIFTKSKFSKEPFQIYPIAQFLFIGDIKKNIIGFNEKYIDKKFLRDVYYSCLHDDINSGT